MHNYTVFITTYNRAQLVIRALDSARNQTHKGCKILIHDDGSTDTTTTTISEWIRSHPEIVVRYQRHPSNRGKPSVWNSALQDIDTRYTVPLDSDDELLPNALELFDQQWKSIEGKSIKDISNFAAVEGLALSGVGSSYTTDPYPTDIMDSNWLALAYYHKLWGGDCRRCYRTEVLKRYPFTIYPNEKAIQDSLITFRMAHHYQVRFFNKPVQRIHSQPVSITRQGKPRRIASAKSFSLCYQELITDHAKYLTPREYFKQATYYIRYSFHAKKSILTQLREIRMPGIYVILFIFGFLGFLHDKLRYSKH